MKEILKRPVRNCTVLVLLCFLLTSTGWLSWEYHLLEQVPTGISDLLTMVAGYLLQAAGIGVFAMILRFRPHMEQRLFPVLLVLHMVCMIPSVMSPYLAGTLIFGFLMNLFCGGIAGYYLYRLTQDVEEHRATVFGIGYGLAILASWLLSLTGGAFYYSDQVLWICAALTVLALYVSRKMPENEEEHQEGTDGKPIVTQKRTRSGENHFLLLACALVLLFSVVNSSGFAFPSADLGGSVNVELSRLVYAAGLIIAGVITDRNRKYGAICALTALMIPFILLALKSESLPTILFWVLSYFTFGFYSVYRTILFSDISRQRGTLYLSGFGLMAGRIGDALGETLCIVLKHRLVLWSSVTALLFAGTMVVFFRVFQSLYVPEGERQQSEQEKFFEFAAQHDLSAREQDMLRLLLEEKKNPEIAEVLSISENTVKFHIRNLLQKTGCKNRNDLLTMYHGRLSM